ncbi:MAG: hypothetical protein EOO77_43655 [Oxalobacteraceae bacterium]|nr:MAG: hypothetical protein EOO77_43655 [Oxalobacteraceae bacterium]
MDIARIIDLAAFDEHDCDLGTAGLCGMFALALFRAVITDRPQLVLIGSTNEGVPQRDRHGHLYWSHAAVEIAGRYYDIEGEQQRGWMFSNYVWSLPKGREPAVIETTPGEFISEMRSTHTAVDRRQYIEWRDRLIKAAATISRR